MKTAIIYGMAAVVSLTYALPGRAEEGKLQSIRGGLECRMQLEVNNNGCVSELNGKKEALTQRMDKEVSACLQTYGDNELVQRGNCVDKTMQSAGRDLSRAYREGAECNKLASKKYLGCLREKSPKQ